MLTSSATQSAAKQLAETGAANRRIASDAPPAPAWQAILSDLLTDPLELLDSVGLDSRDLSVSAEILAKFPLKVPRPFLSRIERGNPDDPLLRQILPLDKESDDTCGYTTDPLSEHKFNPQPGLLHKYRGRVLLMVAAHCAVHCRYCFRRHFDYAENVPGRREWDQALSYIAREESITEVIYSGGDPLAASDRQLHWLSERIASIPHVKRLRIHSRTPVVIPQRVDHSLLKWLGGTRLETVMVIHCNHANEIDESVEKALLALRRAGVTLLNQSVLLKGVNDNLEALQALSERLFEAGVLPYYLHMLDPVSGVAHFDVDESRAKELMSALRNRLPGYLIPRLARETPGERSKTTLL